MQPLARQTSDNSGDGILSPSSTESDPALTSSSSDDSTSQPTNVPPSAYDSTLPPISEPTSSPPLSNSTSLPPYSSSSIPPPLTSMPTTARLINPSISPTSTENLTTIVMTVNGQATTFVSQLPTSLANSPQAVPATNRTAVIAGTTAAVGVSLLVILGAVFAYRKRRLRKKFAVSGKKREGRRLLDGEDFDDDVNLPNMASYHDRNASMGPSTSMPRSTSPTPSLLKSRTAETGSIFREEVWPPPGFIDPIHKQSSQVDLSKIVDDVMGPSNLSSGSGLHESGSSGPHERNLTDTISTSVHSHFSSATTHSNSSLGNVQFPIPPVSLFTDPFSTARGRASISFLPPGASVPRTPGMSSPQIPPSSHYPAYSTSSRISNLSYPVPPLNNDVPPQVPPKPTTQPTTQPKKSSPLARALTGDAKIWLGRSVHRDDPS